MASMKNSTCRPLIFIFCFLFLSLSSVYGSFKVETVYEGSDALWGFDFLNQDELVLTKRSGAMKHLTVSTKVIRTLEGIPAVAARRQGGLLDVVVRRLENALWIYWTYSKPLEKHSTLAIARARYSEGGLSEVSDIFVADAVSGTGKHYGSRIVFDDEGLMFVSIGDRDTRHEAQNLANHTGAILRLNADGSIPAGNPFANQEGTRAEIWSYGHRNPQGMSIHPLTRELWSGEFGPRGGDEINIIAPGKNYGWPVVTHGREYWGPKIGEGPSKEGMEDPVIQFTPSLSYSAIQFYTGDAFPQWKNQLFLACLRTTHLHRLELNEKNEVVSSERLLEDLGERMRMVRTGPDGFLYISTDSGKLVRLVPRA
jgi:aldose sugar dehydrogenase